MVQNQFNINNFIDLLARDVLNCINMTYLNRRKEIYISVDVEADGPIPGPYSLNSIGAAVASIG